MKSMLYDDGKVIMSGILSEDAAVITSTAIKYGLKLEKSLNKDNWLSLSFIADKMP